MNTDTSFERYVSCFIELLVFKADNKNGGQTLVVYVEDIPDQLSAH